MAIVSRQEVVRIIRKYLGYADERPYDTVDAIIEEIYALKPHTPCYLDSPCEYQNPKIILPNDKRKVGKWIFGETMGHSWMKCSECCKSQDGQTLCFTYCPNCGAKMEGAEE